MLRSTVYTVGRTTLVINAHVRNSLADPKGLAIPQQLRCFCTSGSWCAPYQRPLTADDLDAALPKLRNIGIAAHIDAGKTTTTERMLFYAGVLKKIGEVDSGTTTTDYMEEETERGITIQSAAVSLKWKDHEINLIDTPGHVDFTVEVQRSLRVVDGVVALFDASAGVQAQSYTVLKQAKQFHIPVIAFINKMDKSNANYQMSVKSIRQKLGVTPLLVQMPLLSSAGEFDGVIDIINMMVYRFEGERGKQMDAERLTPEVDAHYYKSALASRHDLLSVLSERDDRLSEVLIEALDKYDGDEEKAEARIPPHEITAAVRRQTLQQDTNFPLMPILCGASRRDQGVQPLLDAVLDYLPSPLDRKNLQGFTEDGRDVVLPSPSNKPSNSVLALAFKVVHVPKNPGQVHEPLVFFRSYTGRIQKGMKLYNRTRKQMEVLDRIYVMKADQHEEVSQVSAGSIGAAFLKHSRTGDTLYGPPIQKVVLQKSSNSKKGRGGDQSTNTVNEEVFSLEGIELPPPVISFALEANSLRDIPVLEGALERLEKEDPSLRSSKNEHGQLVVSGMGELHLEIIMSRLKREYELTCSLMKAIIEYRETFTKSVSVESKEPKCCVEIEVEAVPAVDEDGYCDASIGVIPTIPKEVEQEFLDSAEDKREAPFNFNDVKVNFETCVKELTSLGPLAALPLTCFEVKVKKLKCVKGMEFSCPAANEAMKRVVGELLKTNVEAVELVEPLMELEVNLSEPQYIGGVMTSLSERNAHEMEVLDDGLSIRAIVALRNIVRYGVEVRKASKGNAHCWSRLHKYRTLQNSDLRKKILTNLGVKV